MNSTARPYDEMSEHSAHLTLFDFDMCKLNIEIREYVIPPPSSPQDTPPPPKQYTTNERCKGYSLFYMEVTYRCPRFAAGLASFST